MALPVCLYNPIRAWRMAVMLFSLCLAVSAQGEARAQTASRLQEFLAKAQPSDLFKGADRLGAAQGTPPIVPIRARNCSAMPTSIPILPMPWAIPASLFTCWSASIPTASSPG